MNTKNVSYERYGRQILLKELGEKGQQKLLQARVLMIGAGGLGCAALPYLAAAGVGAIGIIDDDKVALHNLHRQVLYTIHDIGSSKVQCAATALRQLNPEVTIKAFHERLTTRNALSLLADYDIVIDGTDNFSTRYMINDACVLLNKPLVYGAVSRFEGQVTVFNWPVNGEAAVNYRDLFADPPADGQVPNCAEAGVLGVLPGIIGGMQANETIKLITGIGTPLANRLFTYNALNNQVYEMQLAAQENSRNRIPADAAAFEQADYDLLCGVAGTGFEIDIEKFNALRLKTGVLIADVREPNELPIINDFEYISIPLAGINEFPDTQMDTIVLFCQSGKRSLQAAKVLSERFGGEKKIFSLAGGIRQWKAHQLSL